MTMNKLFIFSLMSIALSASGALASNGIERGGMRVMAASCEGRLPSNGQGSSGESGRFAIRINGMPRSTTAGHTADIFVESSEPDTMRVGVSGIPVAGEFDPAPGIQERWTQQKSART